MKKVVLKN